AAFGVAELDLFTAQCGRRERRPEALWQRCQSALRSAARIGGGHIMGLDYRERIPNNVDLADNRALQRALEHWQPHFPDWWEEMGPAAFAGSEVYLRTATAVDERRGWASYGMVRMPEYRWGIFLADPMPDRRIGFGDACDEPVWQQVPG